VTQPNANRLYLAAAFLCDRVLEEKDGTVSAIRIIDTIAVTLPPNLTADTKPGIQLKGLVSLKNAEARIDPQTHHVRLQVHTPSGRELPASEVDFVFKPEELAGHNLILNMTMLVEEFGSFWIDVSVDGESITRIPFRLLEQATNLAATIH
jgi:hypothetical protein